MTLIQRQTLIVRALERIYSRRWQNPGLRSRAIRKLGEFNAQRMAFAGYTAQEALDSFRQCIDVARLNHDAIAPSTQEPLAPWPFPPRPLAYPTSPPLSARRASRKNQSAPRSLPAPSAPAALL